tara:strand:+ start:263 stop:1429 length:1167 start_codon:yes stop_codon:yes gene_type:complete
MKKKIAILGSTGSIGKSLLKIVSKDKKNFKVELLSANKNYKDLLKQAKQYKVKNIIITNKNSFNSLLIQKHNNIKVYNNFKNLKKIFPKKIDYVMNSIVGLDGLIPTMNIIKYTKKIAIANKETIICGWNLIKKKLKKYKTEFIPVDSEHFSIWYALKNVPDTEIEKIYLTASGGSLLNVPKKSLKKIKISKIIKHPNWNMGKKITIDSSTLMNKVFEIIEAKKIFDINYKYLGVIIHPKSYIHAVIKFSNGMIKIIAHDTTMEIPITNSLYFNYKKNIKSNKIDFDKLNNLNFKKVNKEKFPSIKILDTLPTSDSLFETAIVSANDELVKLFLEKKINYTDINKNMIKILNTSDVKKFKKKLPSSISEIINTSVYIKSKINSLKFKK